MLRLFLVLFLALWSFSALSHDLKQRPFDTSTFSGETIQFMEDQTRIELRNLMLNPDAELTGFLERVKDRIVRAPRNEPFFREIDIQVHLVRSNEANAFALYDGNIYVNKGMLLAMPDEEAVAAILAHEMAHVVRAHSYQKYEMALKGDQLVNASAPGVVIARSGYEFLKIRGVSRKFEFEADHLAMELMDNAEMDAADFPRALVSLESGAGGKFVSSPTVIQRLLASCSTHPLTCRRVESAAREIRAHDYSFVGRGVRAPVADFERVLALLKK